MSMSGWFESETVLDVVGDVYRTLADVDESGLLGNHRELALRTYGLDGVLHLLHDRSHEFLLLLAEVFLSLLLELLDLVLLVGKVAGLVLTDGGKHILLHVLEFLCQTLVFLDELAIGVFILLARVGKLRLRGGGLRHCLDEDVGVNYADFDCRLCRSKHRQSDCHCQKNLFQHF